MVGGRGLGGPEAPIPAVRQVLDEAELELDDIDLFENNGAFALNNVLFHRELGVPYEKLNVHGGAVAPGHPIGASACRFPLSACKGVRACGVRATRPCIGVGPRGCGGEGRGRRR